MKMTDIPSISKIFDRIREIENLVSPKKPQSAVEIQPNLSNQEKSFQDYMQDGVKNSTEINAFDSNAVRGIEKEPSSLSPLENKIQVESAKNGLNPDLVKALIQTESNFNPRAVSPKGAQGLMQLMPSTAKILGVEDPMDPMENVEGGTKYLGDLMNQFRDTKLALAAYNAGPNAVKKYNGVPPFRETQDYLQKIEKLMNQKTNINIENLNSL
ncbi:lytic transglycosylase domain-containing protein [Leptospira sp. GIMC2001]|uniref:lytic transglycosylase domain-containing protein n=1 Tax=Leptospira sp. GIMC2001 TaxID=1513297 RepID=UPI00234BAEBF|nr:lytic transglycosylase domain-containing protein [Leptospira sp. GIMC2001]WCL47683.1 lytic transglycosylase domain-containing protein [Leptospira sp. GIMC2001]